MNRPPRPAPRLLPAALALLTLAACARCGSCQPAGKAAPPRLATVEAELASLEAPGTPPGSEVEGAAQAFVNEWGTAGAFVAVAEGTARLIRGRTVSKPYPGIGDVVFSPDGSRTAYVVPSGQRFRLVIDGDEGPEVESLTDLTFTPDGRHVTYKVASGTAWRFAVDRSTGDEVVSVSKPVFAPDGAILVVEQGRPRGPFAVASYDAALRRTSLLEVAAEEVAVAPGGRRAAAIVAVGEKLKVVTHDLPASGPGREGEAFDDLMGVAFDATGEHLMYAAYRGEDLFMVLDGKAEALPATSILESPVYNAARGVVGLVLSSDAIFFHLAFAPAGPKAKGYHGVRNVTGSPDGLHWAFVAELGDKDQLVVDGKEGPMFDRVVGPVYSPDSKTLAYRARQDGKRFVVLAEPDGTTRRRLGDHEQVFPVAFTPDGTAVAYAAKDGPSLRWKVEKL